MTATPLLPPKGDPARNWACATLLAFPLAFAALALFLGQDASWDFRNYHFYNAWAFVTGRYTSGIDFLPSQGQFFFNPLLDVPFYFLATHIAPKCAYFILSIVQGLNFPLLFMICYATLVIKDTKKKTAACAGLAALGMLSAMGIAEAGTQCNDNLVSLGILSSALLVIRNFDFLLSAQPKATARAAFIYALPAGCAAGLKLTCISFCAGMCIALLIATPDARRCFRLCFLFGLGLLAGFALTYGHWAWYLTSHYASPMFPFYNSIFRSPLLPSVALIDFPTPRNWTLPVFPFFFGIDPLLVNEIWWRDWRTPLLYALFILVTVQYLVSGKKTAKEPLARPAPLRFLLLTAGIGYYIWLFTQTVYRYLLPLDMLSPLLIVLCVGLLPLEIKRRWTIATGLIVVAALSISPGDWARRGTWTQKITDISVPAIPEKTMVLMGGVDAYAFLLPAFPPSVSFVRLESRGFPPDSKTGLADLIRSKVEVHKGPLKLFIPSAQLKLGERALPHFKLSLVLKSCRIIDDRLYEPHLDRTAEMGNSYPKTYSLCDVKRY